jgi:hypothetical protein
MGSQIQCGGIMMNGLKKRIAASLGLGGLSCILFSALALAAVYADREVYFSSTAGVYTDAQAIADFGSIKQKTQTDRITISSAGHLVFFMPQGGVGTSGSGGQILADLQPKDDYTVVYRVRFNPITGTYDWTEGGKLPGVGGGKNYTGGNGAQLGDGFSVRLHFKPGGHLIPYVYHADMEGSYGDGFGPDMNTQALKDVVLSSNMWHTIKIYVKVNTESNNNGVLKIYIDDMNTPKFTKTDIKYVTNGSKVDTLHLTAFHGGSDPVRFGPSHDQKIDFDWVKIHQGIWSPS